MSVFHLQEKLVRARVELVFYRDAAKSIAKSVREAGVAEQMVMKQRDDNNNVNGNSNDKYTDIPNSYVLRDADESIVGHDRMLEELHAAVAVEVASVKSTKQEVDSSYCALLLLKEQTEDIEAEIKTLKTRLAVTARENERALRSITNPSSTSTGHEHDFASRRPSVSACHSPRTPAPSTLVLMDGTYTPSTPVLLADSPSLSVSGGATPITCVTPSRAGGFPCLSPLRISRTVSLRGE